MGKVYVGDVCISIFINTIAACDHPIMIEHLAILIYKSACKMMLAMVYNTFELIQNLVHAFTSCEGLCDINIFSSLSSKKHNASRTVFVNNYAPAHVPAILRIRGPELLVPQVFKNSW